VPYDALRTAARCESIDAVAEVRLHGFVSPGFLAPKVKVA
jgi:hypothetical protein